MDLTPYTGMRARLRDPVKAAVLYENSSISRRVYRAGTVDSIFFDEAIVLTEDTASALYEDFTPLDQPFVAGSRTFLEKIVAHTTAGLTSDRDKALALLDFVNYIPMNYQHASGEPFHGGAEEEVIRKGSSMCNEQARVLCILAQIAGIPSRYIGHMTPIDYDDKNSATGHGVSELYLEGAWAYMDIRGIYFLKSDGKFASAWELIQNPDLIEQQSAAVIQHRHPHYDYSGSKKYFHPDSIHVIINYLAKDHARYDYSWVYPSSSLWLEGRETGRRIRVTEHQALLPQPTIRV